MNIPYYRTTNAGLVTIASRMIDEVLADRSCQTQPRKRTARATRSTAIR